MEQGLERAMAELKAFDDEGSVKLSVALIPCQNSVAKIAVVLILIASQ